MRRTLLLCALAFATLPLLMKLVEYRYWMGTFSSEVYIGFIALLFTAIGIWTGSWLLKRSGAGKKATLQMLVQTQQTALSGVHMKNPGLSQREMEVLQLMSEGLSNQEIADKLFLSLSTVKTHSSNLFLKMNAKRRTQAVANAKSIGLIR